MALLQKQFQQHNMAITKVRASSIDLTTDTTQLSMAKGTTAQRPTGASSLSAEYLIVAGGGGLSLIHI